jgi:hypothetical protein
MVFPPFPPAIHRGIVTPQLPPPVEICWIFVSPIIRWNELKKIKDITMVYVSPIFALW